MAFVVLAGCSNDDTTSARTGEQDPQSTTTLGDATTSSLVGSSTTEPPGPLAGSQITFGVFGPIEVGMSRVEMEHAAGLDIREDRLDPNSNCAYWFAIEEQHVDFIALDGRLATITVGGPYTTEHGIGAGATREEIVGAYGVENVQERTSRFQVKEFLVTPTDPEQSDLGLLFRRSTVEREGVQFITTGTLEGLDLDEGCA